MLDHSIHYRDSVKKFQPISDVKNQNVILYSKTKLMKHACRTGSHKMGSLIVQDWETPK